MSEKDEFNTLAFEKRLLQLKDTQESIQSMSAWCLKQRSNHKKIVASWLNVLKRVKIEQRLTLFYLANDVIQYSKRKNYEFVASWGCFLQKATPLVRDEKVRTKILRIFKIWEERSVYDDEFLSDLTGLLSAGASKKAADDDPLDFQPQQLVNKIRQCMSLETDTDLCLKYIHESHLELSDADALCASLKDRRNKDDVEKELNEGITCVEKYTQALQKEIVAREALLAILKSANQYYSTQRGEVKVVALAYKSFGQRVRALKRKLDELTPKLPSAAPSPPQRDEDVPSPGPDEDLDLPILTDGDENDVTYNIDKTFNTSLTADGSLYNLGLSSFLGGDNTINLFNESNSQGSNDNTGKNIEVISNKSNDKQDMSINDLLMNIVLPNDNNSDNNSVLSGTISQKSQDTLPGLDLLTAEVPAALPPTFYRVLDNHTPEEPEHYRAEVNHQWNNNSSWPTLPSSAPPVMVPPVAPLAPPLAPLVPPPVRPPPVFPQLYSDTPESPPPPAAPPTAPPLVPDTGLYLQDLPPSDVDHRGLLPPPPPPPVLAPIGQLEDVDHRLLPVIPLPPPLRHMSSSQDVDHRNLISLTHQGPLQRPLSRGMDQDYRVPPPGPNDIVESVDMELSEDEEQIQQMYSNQQMGGPGTHFNNTNFKPDENHRRHSFKQNNKILVGGSNLDHKEDGNPRNPNLIRINSLPNDDKRFNNIEKPSSAPPLLPEPLTAPPLMPLLSNPFESLPNMNPVTPPQSSPFVNNFPNFPQNSKTDEVNFDNIEEAVRLMDEEVKSNDSAFDEDIRSRFRENNMNQELVRNPSPPTYSEFADWLPEEDEYNIRPPMPHRNFMMNQPNPRFPRNWNPVMRTNFRPQGFMPQQFWPRNAPRPPNRPWPGHRPRFW